MDKVHYFLYYILENESLFFYLHLIYISKYYNEKRLRFK